MMQIQLKRDTLEERRFSEYLMEIFGSPYRPGSLSCDGRSGEVNTKSLDTFNMLVNTLKNISINDYGKGLNFVAAIPRITGMKKGYYFWRIRLDNCKTEEFKTRYGNQYNINTNLGGSK